MNVKQNNVQLYLYHIQIIFYKLRPETAPHSTINFRSSMLPELIKDLGMTSSLKVGILKFLSCHTLFFLAYV